MGHLLRVAGLGLVATAAMLLIGATFPVGHTAAAYVPMLGVVVLTCIGLRVFHPAASIRQTAIGCFGIGMMMLAARIVWFVSNQPVLSQQPLRLVRFVAVEWSVAALGSALAAFAVWKPSGAISGGAVARVRGWSLALLCSGVAFAVAYVGVSLRFAPNLSELAASAGLSVFVFFHRYVWIALAVYLPVMLVGQRFLRHRAWMVAAGVVLFPVPMVVMAPLSFQTLPLSVLWRMFHQHPGSALLMALPYIVGGALLGWMLGKGNAAAPPPARFDAGAALAHP